MALPFNRTKLLFLAIIVLLCLGAYLFYHAGEESTDDAAIAAHVLTVSPKISGYVKRVIMEDNQRVKAGDLLVEMDPTDYQIRRDRAQAALESAQAAYDASSHNLNTTMISAPSSVEAAQAEVNAAQANWKKAANDLRRMQALSNEARSREQLDAAVAAERTARSNLDDAEAKLRSAKTAPKVIASAKSSRASLAAQVKQAQADLDQAEQDLSNTRIVAAEDGYVTNRTVEAGDYVAPGAQLGSIVGKEKWVVANFKETQLTKMHPGERATIEVDAFPKLTLKGRVDSIQRGTGAQFSAFPPENATGNFVKVVQRVPVKILFDSQPDPTIPLGVGMSVEPTVYTK